MILAFCLSSTCNVEGGWRRSLFFVHYFLNPSETSPDRKCRWSGGRTQNEEQRERKHLYLYTIQIILGSGQLGHSQTNCVFFFNPAHEDWGGQSRRWKVLCAGTISLLSPVGATDNWKLSAEWRMNGYSAASNTTLSTTQQAAKPSIHLKTNTGSLFIRSNFEYFG